MRLAVRKVEPTNPNAARFSDGAGWSWLMPFECSAREITTFSPRIRSTGAPSG
jgi:hypothetical protein